MSYRPKIKADSSGTLQDLPLDAETVQGKIPVFTTTDQSVAGVKTYTGNQIFTGYLDIRGTASEKHLKTRGIGGSDGNGNESDLYLQYNSSYATKFGKTGNGSLNSDGTITEAGTLLSNKYAAKSHTHTEYLPLDGGGIVKGNLNLYTERGDSPRLTFQHGALIDNYNDWSIYDSGGYLYIQQIGSNSNAWETIATFTQSGVEFNGTIKENGISLADKYSPIGHSHESVKSVIDYGDTNKTIKIGYSGAGLTASQILYIAGYTAGDNDNEHKIKDISKDVLKSWLGYAEVVTGTIRNNSLNIANGNYLWIVYPTVGSATSFSFTSDNSTYTAYHFAIIQSGHPGSIRYFKNTTTLAIVKTTSIGFSGSSGEVHYIKFKVG